MTDAAITSKNEFPDPRHDTFSKTIAGFWIYIMSDCILFSCLFSCYIVLRRGTFGGPPASELFYMPGALAETLVLLTSSFTCAIAMLAAARLEKNKMIAWYVVTFVLGCCFLGIELNEFIGLVKSGNSWERSAFLSSFFTLVGTHGLHITMGLLWMIVLIVPVIFQGITPVSYKRLTCLSMYWHFLDIVWVFIFTIVYLLDRSSIV